MAANAVPAVFALVSMKPARCSPCLFLARLMLPETATMVAGGQPFPSSRPHPYQQAGASDLTSRRRQDVAQLPQGPPHGDLVGGAEHQVPVGRELAQLPHSAFDGYFFRRTSTGFP